MKSGPARLRSLEHGLVAVWFVVLAVWVSYPLILDPGGQIPGRGSEDNVSFLWNFWWFRHALDTGRPLFHTSHLFAPFGTPLVQHTHTALPALAGATLLRGMPLVAAHTTILLAGLAANGLAAYALAYYHVKRVMPALLAGVVFASSVFVTLRLLGHFNFVHAWVCPVAALAWIACLDRPTVTRGALAGIAFAAVVWTDYYYAVFCGIFAAAWWLATAVGVEARWAGRRFPGLERLTAALAVLAAIALVTALATDGLQFHLLGSRVSISNARNPIALLWVLSLLLVALRVRMRITLRVNHESGGTQSGSTIAALAAAAAVGAVLIAPMALAVFQLFEAGDHVTPPRHWQSGPQGIDLLTTILGNPVHSTYGALVERLYQAAGIDLVEQTAWLGIVPLVAIGLLVVDRTQERCAGRWLWIGGLFLIWAAGAFLVVGGFDTGLPLPQALAHYVPVLSNARVPGRAVVMVQLAAAMICAVVAATRQWKASTIWIVTAVVIADGAAVPIPMYRLPPAGSIEQVLTADAVPGAVLEIPAGVRDGIGQMGYVDHRALWFQTIHGRPIVGGFAARLPDRVARAYAADSALMAFFEQRHEAIPQDLGRRLALHGIRYVALNRDKTSRELRGALQRSDLSFVTADGDRELYRVH
jgi:hypothetical protein